MSVCSLALFALLVGNVFTINRREISVFLDGSNWRYKSGIDNSAIAYGWVRDDMFTTGWDTLEIASNKDFPNKDQAFAAGYAEGLLTVNRMQHHFRNSNGSHVMGSGGVCHGAQPEVDEQMAFIERQLKQEEQKLDNYWQQIGLLWRQAEGLLHGYNELASASNQMTFREMYCMQAAPELGDLLRSRPSYVWPNFDSFSQQDWDKYFEKNVHCSSLVKVTPSLSELYFGHSTWSAYQFMMRQMKTYILPYKNVGTASTTVIFSGYPGVLVSEDDFYVVSAGLSVIETTNSVFNSSLFRDYIHPGQQVPYWLRVATANRMAHDAADWGPIFSKYNSGTYNNQWIVVDIKKFTPGKPLIPGTLWILEQLPGFIANGDQTSILQFGYWPSYNVPFYRSIFSLANYTHFAALKPEDLSYQLASRAQIFRRSETTVDSLSSYKSLMRYNDYKHDPLSHDNPGYAIASRMDLRKKPACWGATDTKVSSGSLFHQGMVVHAISGPTRSHGLPAFAFNTTKAACGKMVGEKFGFPEVYDFEFQVFKPEKI
eukprot:TRINITY_DN66617_c2_g2_i1.p1 TRINITY_DN66617_c2_g2~~TRINITY_DN66617_c2_g2_i1.p1  ORF type:complete len:551 (+),score=24.45 TRINITY_DN66617_c2_g2_i1:29-1654(+)